MLTVRQADTLTEGRLSELISDLSLSVQQSGLIAELQANCSSCPVLQINVCWRMASQSLESSLTKLLIKLPTKSRHNLYRAWSHLGFLGGHGYPQPSSKCDSTRCWRAAVKSGTRAWLVETDMVREADNDSCQRLGLGWIMYLLTFVAVSSMKPNKKLFKMTEL